MPFSIEGGSPDYSANKLTVTAVPVSLLLNPSEQESNISTIIDAMAGKAA